MMERVINEPSPAPEGAAQLYAALENAQSIRLFRISPENTGQLVLELNVFHLETDDCPPFASLSYMWGIDDPCHDILVNGTAVEIRPNAFLFLETLRNHQRRRIGQGSRGLPGCYPCDSSWPGISPGNGSRPLGPTSETIRSD
jgi:hypothetical protein